MPGFDVAPLGDGALLLRAGSRRGAHDDVRVLLEARARIEAAEIPGVTEVILGFESIAILLDPFRAWRAGAPEDEITSWVGSRVTEALSSGAAESEQTSATAPVDIPVCYDAEFAIDLGQVARRAGLATEEIVERHSNADYCVRCVGFTPGFPYLSGLPPELATPRRATPRNKVPAGAVAIGGFHAGIYPVSSPGGWHVIGRTPLRLFDALRAQPALLQAGDRVRFRPISREEYNAAANVLE